MKIISIDVGIKNMAFCLFDISGSTTRIIDWKVLSMLDEDAPVIYCNAPAVKTVLKKQKKLENFFIPTPTPETRLCGHVAKYTKGSKCYCVKHAKSQSLYHLPNNKKIGKMSLKELSTYATDSLGLSDLPKKKSDLLSVVENYLKERCLDPVHVKKSANAGDADLVLIGKNMKQIFQQVLESHSDISHVLIENQISPLANRMKTIQGMLAQYFIMMYDSIHIEFVSSINKLKMFSKEKENVDENKKDSETQCQKYKQHKKDGVFYCEQILASGKWSNDLWIKCEKKKKDDLADCFLQGIWWLKKHNFIDI
jgi:hypothetical protein